MGLGTPKSTQEKENAAKRNHRELLGSQSSPESSDILNSGQDELSSLSSKEILLALVKRSKITDEFILNASKDSNAILESIKTNVEQLSTEVSQMKEELKTKFLELDVRVENVEKTVAKNSRDISNILLKSQLVISGIPLLPDEDLMKYFGSICSVFGFDENSIPHTFLRRTNIRQKVANSTTIAEPTENNQAEITKQKSTSPLILVEFALRGAKDEFFRRYLNFKSLNLQHIGFQSTQRIYVNESLSKDNQKIKFECMKLKKGGTLSSVLTIGGHVFVRRPNSDIKEMISSLSQLAAMMPSTTS